MSNLSIKDVPEPWAQALRQRAVRNHRSLQGELLAMVQAVVLSEEALMANPNSAAGKGTKQVEQIAQEIGSIRPSLSSGAPLAVNILRAERDAH
jgi:antitoxin FitA